MSPNKTTVTTPSDREILITRAFDAPRRLVWDLHTKPELLKRWLFGPDGWVLEVCTVDLRVGGKARFEAVKQDDKFRMGWTDTYTEVVPQERLVSRQLFDEDWTQGETTVTLRFRDAGYKTVLEMTVLYSSKEARDGAVNTGMLQGMEMGYARLDEIFKELVTNKK